MPGIGVGDERTAIAIRVLTGLMRSGARTTSDSLTRSPMPVPIKAVAEARRATSSG